MTYSSEFVESNGIRLHYLRWASGGPPLVIVHGNTHCGGVYEPLAERLSPEYEVYALDLRGHGLSDKGDSYSWKMLRDDLVGMLDALDLRNVLLVAHSRGGGACLLAAAMRPERVRGVVGYEPNVPLQLWHDENTDDRVRDLVARAARRRSTWPDREAMYGHFLGRGAFKDWQDEYLRAFVRHAAVDLPDGTIGLASPTFVEGEMYKEIFNFEEWKKVEACPVPALAIYGTDSGRMKAGEDPVSELRKLFLHVDLRTMGNATHSGPMEHPDAFERFIRDFAAGLAPD
jgi:pimeloyl-ACP methyl ester carboxylesterase